MWPRLPYHEGPVASNSCLWLAPSAPGPGVHLLQRFPHPVTNTGRAMKTWPISLIWDNSAHVTYAVVCSHMFNTWLLRGWGEARFLWCKYHPPRVQASLGIALTVELERDPRHQTTLPPYREASCKLKNTCTCSKVMEVMSIY